VQGKNAGGVQKCVNTLLRLRLKRVGKALHYLWAPGVEGDDFQEIKVQEEFGDADITAVRMSVITGREPCNVDVRFLDFHIGSGGLKEAKGPNAAPFVPQAIEGNVPGHGVPAARSWLFVASVIGLGILMLAAAGVAATIFMLRRKKSVPTPAAPQVEMISFHCLACGKMLKTKSSAVGKKIKCAKCGNVSLVPARDAIEATDA
jgi:DNA-directed RNA polymerase subunit RPC12/RpoP